MEIIGEAMKRILTVDSNFAIDNAKNIIGTINRMIHSYDNIIDDVIWTIVIRELPILKNQIAELTREI